MISLCTHTHRHVYMSTYIATYFHTHIHTYEHSIVVGKQHVGRHINGCDGVHIKYAVAQRNVKGRVMCEIHSLRKRKVTFKP